MFIYRTELFLQQIQEQSNLYGQINRLCDELASMSLEQVQSRFERIYPFLKRKEGNLRLIARIYRVDKTPILCWLGLFRRGDHAYEDFLRDRENYAHQPWTPEVEENVLREWLKQQKAPPTDSTTSSLPQSLRPWLDRPNWVIDTNQLLIYESPTWMEEFQKAAIRPHWKRYNQLIINLVDPQTSLNYSYSKNGVTLYGEDNYFILSAHLITQDDYPREILFLLCPFIAHPSQGEIDQIIEKSELDFSQPIFLDELTNYAERAYPSELIVAERYWLDIEDEAATNLALSAEEEAILHSVSTSSPSLPLFLNGQAGSGKSTMLFHLFADYCYRHFLLCEEQQTEIFEKPHPLFLGYNERLIKVAKEQVATLLKYHHRFTEQKKIANPLSKITPFFKTFREFLHTILPPQDQEIFSPDKYISFHRFRQLCRRHLPRYSPEKCWLVIRTFIKGYHLDERENYLSIEDYQEIPNKEKVISENEFIDIYNRVWHWYEKHTQQTGEWDDQDLIRWVLHHQYYSPDYTAIFCDEAQDFTRLELQLIMRLSVFSQYDLEHEDVLSLPFAFAGDPLQTLNPTGFRWASLKATFYNEVLTVLSPTGNLNLEMNFQELVCNYRSFPAIVGLNNLIQLWRKQLFNLSDIKPQTPRKIGDRAPEKYIIGQNLSSEEAKLYLQNSLIILPCDEAGEEDYVRNDDLLKELFPEIKQGNQPWNTLSAIKAKGLEFKQVILYKFGDHCPKNIFKPDHRSSEKLKYFFNKLYVAISRATEQLLIVDTPKGEKELWQYATNLDLSQSVIKSTTKHLNKWENAIHSIQWGNAPENLGKDDPKILAETLMKEGLNNKNPDLLWRSRQAYQRLKEEEKALFCEAEALQLEGELIAAGNCFFHQQNFPKAWDCFWQGMGWQELETLYHHLEATTTKTEENTWLRLKKNYPLIKYMAQAKRTEETPNLSQIEAFTQFVLSNLNNQQFYQESLTPPWKAAFKVYGQQISQLISREVPQEKTAWENYAQVLEKISEITQQTKFINLAGDCYFRSQNYQNAIRCWEASNDIQKPQYYRAKAYLLGMPQGLEYLVRSGNNQEILEKWEKAKKPLTKEWLTYVAPVLESNQNYEVATRAYAHLNQKYKVEKCFHKISNPTPSLVRFLIHYYLYFQHWEEMITTLENYPLSPSQQPELNKESLITRLAQSQLTPDHLNSQQRQRLEKVIQEKISPQLPEKSLLIYQLGMILEKIGSIVQSLRFYERYVNDKSRMNLREFSRQRWLAIKKKQALYFQKQGQTNKADNLEKELKQRATSWNIDPQKIHLNPPRLPKKQITSKQNQEKPLLQLPPDTKIQSSPEGIIQLQVRHLNIKIMKKARQVLMTDSLTLESFRIDGLTRQMKIGEMILKAPPEQSLSFMSPSGNYSGRIIYYQSRCQLELSIQGVSDKLRISF